MLELFIYRHFSSKTGGSLRAFIDTGIYWTTVYTGTDLGQLVYSRCLINVHCLAFHHHSNAFFYSLLNRCGILVRKSWVEPHSPCSGRQNLQHWTTREGSQICFKKLFASCCYRMALKAETLGSSLLQTSRQAMMVAWLRWKRRCWPQELRS